MKHLLAAIESSLQSENHYAALAVALTLPDICGWVLDPQVTSKARCISWFEKYLQASYTAEVGPDHLKKIFLNGSDFYALRCAYLHEGRDEIADQRARSVLDRFQFVVPPNGWEVHMNMMNKMLQLQVNVFCRGITGGVERFLVDISSNSDATRRLQQLLFIRDLRGSGEILL